MRALYLTPFVVILLFAMVMLAKLLDSEAPPPSPLIGKPIPAFVLKSPYEGEPDLNTADFKGSYRLLNIFASWCFTCRLEHPLLKKLHEHNVVEIDAVAWKDKPENTRAWLEKNGNPYTRIGTDLDGKVAIDLGITGAPETFLLSPEGVVLYRHVGPLTEEVFETKIRPLLR